MSEQQDKRFDAGLIERLAAHEESMLAQRLTIFLLGNSLLFLGFATMQIGTSNKPRALLTVVAAAGIVVCVLLFLNCWRVKKTLKFFYAEDQELGKLHKKRSEYLRETWFGCFSEIGRADNAFYWLFFVFFVIWAFSLWTVWFWR